jgi:chondroitin AC lyase
MFRRLLLTSALAACLPAYVATASKAAPQTATVSADSDIAMIKGRLKARYVGKDFSKASQYLATETVQGTWPDINYADRSINWDPQKHLDRLAQMVIAYENQKSPNFHSVKMLQGITNGLTYWYINKPVSDSWWSNDIGQQLALETILVLMDGDLSPDMIRTGTAFFLDPSQVSSTGQNLVWLAGEELVRGVLRNDAGDVQTAVRRLESVDAIKTDEGIQPDHSFHQHGPQLYVGGYGLGFLQDSLTYARLVDGTRFAFAPDKIGILADYLLDGSRYMVRGPMLDYGAIGRDIARSGGGKEALGLISACDQLSILRPDKKPDCDALKAHIEGSGAPYSFLGHKHFWNSDFTVHQRSGYYTSVKLASARTYGTEKVNNENLKGYWIPFGTNYTVRRGDEYEGIFPVWDWAHLPGVTCPVEIPTFVAHVEQRGLFAGGASDGKYGVSAMKLDIQSAPSIHAYKAWFFFDDEFVALGAGISSSDNVPVNTTLNQTLLYGTVMADNKAIASGQHVLNAVSWVLHDGVGYVLPKKADVVVSAGPHSGSWSTINALESTAPVTKDVFALWINHGTRPANASYQYIVVPGIDSKRLAEYAGKIPVQILANTAEVQAARHELLGIAGIVFYSPGQVSLRNGLTVSADQPCMVLLEESATAAKMAVSSPRGPLQVHVSLSLPGGIKTTTFDLRGGPAQGESQIQTVKLQ